MHLIKSSNKVWTFLDIYGPLSDIYACLPLVFIRNEPRVPTSWNGQEQKSKNQRKQNLHWPGNILKQKLKFITSLIKLEVTDQQQQQKVTVTIWIHDRMGVWYSKGKVTGLVGPFKYWTFWTINRLFCPVFIPSFEYEIIWQPDINLPFEY